MAKIFFTVFAIFAMFGISMCDCSETPYPVPFIKAKNAPGSILHVVSINSSAEYPESGQEISFSLTCKFLKNWGQKGGESFDLDSFLKHPGKFTIEATAKTHDPDFPSASTETLVRMLLNRSSKDLTKKDILSGLHSDYDGALEAGIIELDEPYTTTFKLKLPGIPNCKTDLYISLKYESEIFFEFSGIYDRAGWMASQQGKCSN